MKLPKELQDKKVTKEYRWIDTKDLEFSDLRDVRKHTVEQIKESILSIGFDDARVLVVIPNNNGKFTVAGGNHRLDSALDLGIKSLPCLIVHNGDLYQLAIQDNEAEKTFAPIDLFDWLNMIKNLKDQGLKQKEIGEKIGWTREMVNYYNKINKKIVTQVLDLCKSHQKDRVNEKVTNVTFDFTEGWFRSSGLYYLTKENQLKALKWFIETKKGKVSKDLLNKECLKYKEIQDQIKLVKCTLDPDIDNTKIIESVEKGEYSIKRLESVIKKLNEGAKSKALFGVDCLDELDKLEANTVDCLITDPPWGVEYKPSRKTENPKFDENLEKVLDLFNEVMKKCERVLKENAHIYIFFPTTFYIEFKEVLERYFYVYPMPLIWYKNNHNLCNFKRRYASIYETIFFCKMKKGDLRELNNNFSRDVLPFDKQTNKNHDAQKPEPLLEYLINNSTGKGEIVLDPFAGSGSTLISAIKNERYYIGFELEILYESKFKRRLGDIL